MTARRVLAAALTLIVSMPLVAQANERYAVIVSGASGGAEYVPQYAKWTEALSQALIDGMKFDPARVTVLSDTTTDESAATAANVRRVLGASRQRMAATDLLFVVLIGHGTFDGVDAKFNLVGPDLDSSAWAGLFRGLPGRVILINTSSSSFPFIERFAAPRRIVVSATDSVAQRFDTVFPE